MIDILRKEIQGEREFPRKDEEFQGEEFLRKHISIKI